MLNHLLRGAGGPSASAGLDFLPDKVGKANQPAVREAEASTEVVAVRPPRDKESWGLTRLAIRELTSRRAAAGRQYGHLARCATSCR